MIKRLLKWCSWLLSLSVSFQLLGNLDETLQRTEVWAKSSGAFVGQTLDGFLTTGELPTITSLYSHVIEPFFIELPQTKRSLPYSKAASVISAGKQAIEGGIPETKGTVPPVTIPDSSEQVTAVNDQQPQFTPEELSLAEGAWQHFSDIDRYNRVGVAEAMLGVELMPTKSRESLYINPTGWKQKKLKTGDWLYNRCHLIGFQLTGENNNIKNLMTGTRSFNVPGMVDYENRVAKYIKETRHHVRYRVTPDFQGSELVARGLRLEAQSIEDATIRIHVYIKNTQPSYDIDYQTGRATLAE